jgi:hypothetical protein
LRSVKKSSGRFDQSCLSEVPNVRIGADAKPESLANRIRNRRAEGGLWLLSWQENHNSIPNQDKENIGGEQ